MMKKVTGLAILVIALAFLVPSGFSQEETTITGYVRDPFCFAKMDAKGEKHRKCAMACARAGINLVIEEEGSGKIYLVFPEKDQTNPNTEQLIDFAEREVKVTGEVLTLSGLTGISVKKVEGAE